MPSGTQLASRLSERYGERITGQFTVPGRLADLRPLPADLPERLAAALRARGITSLYSHQAQAWQAAKDRQLLTRT